MSTIFAPLLFGMGPTIFEFTCFFSLSLRYATKINMESCHYLNMAALIPRLRTTQQAIRKSETTAWLSACRRQEQLLMDGVRMPTDTTQLGAILTGQILSTTMCRRMLQCG